MEAGDAHYKNGYYIFKYNSLFIIFLLWLAIQTKLTSYVDGY